MTTVEVSGILPPPSYRHRQPPPQQNQEPYPEHDQQQQHPHHKQQSRSGTQTSQFQTPQQQNGSGNDPDPSSKASTPGVAIMAGSSGGLGVDLSPHQSFDLSYMHRPPAILPNYGKRTRGSVLPKSNVNRVLLYDNITQQTMLDVRMNSIRSQSYKTSRELDMHMKSFLTRRKVREKALKKITRVQHQDDYMDFVLEQDPTSVSSHFPHQVGDRPGHFLPHIESHKRRENKHKSQSKSLSAARAKSNNSVKGAHRTHSHRSISPDSGVKDSSTSLPQIDITPPSQGLDVPAPERSRKIGIREVKSEQGVTRMFSIVTEEEEIPTEDLTNEQIENDSEHITRTNIGDVLDDDTKQSNADENNNSIDPTPATTPTINPTPDTPGDTEDNATKTLEKPHLKPRMSIFQMQKKKEEEEVLHQHEELKIKNREPTDIPVERHPEKPMIDSRFLYLRRLLVPQEPPNEGFAELSPSFPKKYPSVPDLSPRQEVVVPKGQERVYMANGVGDLSEDDDNYKSDSSDDEEEGG